MDIQNTIISAKIVIESLIVLLENENVGFSSISFTIGNSEQGIQSEELGFKSLVDITLEALNNAKQAQKVAVPNIGLKVEIINPDDTAEDGIKVGDQGVIVWFDDEHKVYGINFPKSGKTFSYALSDFKIVEFCGVPDGFVLVEVTDLREIISTASDAMMDEQTSSVYNETGEPSTWFDHYTVAEKRVLAMIEAQEKTND